MKLISEKITTTKISNYTLDNVTICVVFINDEFDHYFINNEQCKKLYYIEDISKYQNVHFSEHSNLLQNEPVFKTIEGLSNIDVNKLYYIGGGTDGMLADRNMNYITNLVHISDIHMQTYQKINTYKKSLKAYHFLSKNKYVKKCNIIEIPSYNRNKMKHTHTISMDVLLPQDVFLSMLKKHTHINYEVQNNITSFLLKEIE